MRERWKKVERLPEGRAETQCKLMSPTRSWLAETDAQNQQQPQPQVCPPLPAVTLPAYHHIIMMNRSGACCRPPTAHPAKQWVAMANITTPRSLSRPLYLPSSFCHRVLLLLPSLIRFSLFCNFQCISVLYAFFQLQVGTSTRERKKDSWRFNT